MLKVRYTAKFKKDLKLILKRGYDPKLFEEVLFLLREGKPLAEKYKDHPLRGIYTGHREWGISPILCKLQNGNIIKFVCGQKSAFLLISALAIF